MKRIRITGSALLIGAILLGAGPVRGEYIGFKFNLATRSIGDDDINMWVGSLGRLWQDWKDTSGGRLDGEFSPLSYGAGLEIEMRIPLFAGLSLNLAGTRYSSQGEGTITLEDSGPTRNESQFIRNEVSALPIKIGFSYSYSLPMLPKLSVVAQGGRSVTFITYRSEDRYQAYFQRPGREDIYQLERAGSYRSEALGYYIGLGVEFELVRFLALTADVENIWSSAAGFKGDFEETLLISQNGIVDENGSYTKDGSASLYFYQADPLGIGQMYDYLAAAKKRPDNPGIENIRQAELDFSHFSIKIGIRFKF